MFVKILHAASIAANPINMKNKEFFQTCSFIVRDMFRSYKDDVVDLNCNSIKINCCLVHLLMNICEFIVINHQIQWF